MIKSPVPITYRPPVITILGHVDHGKTTLLDRIRKTNIAGKEFGGITQHIGTYSVIHNSKKITFIDTPGHVAFSKMRSQGVEVADIAVLVVAANDGVMPQTIESIEYIKQTKIPCIVAINKIDLPDVNIEKIKKQLTKQGLKLEEYGGESPVVSLSAKTGEGIDKLLEMILLLSELHEIKDASNKELKAVVIESSVSKNKGIVGTVIVRSGQISIKDEVASRDQDFRIRAILDWNLKQLNTIKCGEGGEILGWKKVPIVGSVLFHKLQKHQELLSPSTATPQTAPVSTPGQPTLSQSQEIEEEKIKIIIKADTVGTLEAIINSLPKNNITVIESGVGDINESDVLLAKTTKAAILSFHLKLDERVSKLAESEKVIIKTYNIIYELLEEIDEVIKALKEGAFVKTLGTAKVLAIFKIKDQAIAGVKVISGRIARGDLVKIMREENEIGQTRIKSLKHQKSDITKAEQGLEAGVLFSNNLEILTGDSIISIG